MHLLSLDVTRRCDARGNRRRVLCQYDVLYWRIVPKVVMMTIRQSKRFSTNTRDSGDTEPVCDHAWAGMPLRPKRPRVISASMCIPRVLLCNAIGNLHGVCDDLAAAISPIVSSVKSRLVIVCPPCAPRCTDSMVHSIDRRAGGRDQLRNRMSLDGMPVPVR